MNKHYYNRYLKLIQYCQENKFEGYTESHHIIPTCVGGTNDKSNLVQCSYRVHILLHILLYKTWVGINSNYEQRFGYAMVSMLQGRVKQKTILYPMFLYRKVCKFRIANSPMRKGYTYFRNIITNEIKLIKVSERTSDWVGLSKGRKASPKSGLITVPRTLEFELSRVRSRTSGTYVTPYGEFKSRLDLQLYLNNKDAADYIIRTIKSGANMNKRCMLYNLIGITPLKTIKDCGYYFIPDTE